MSEYLTRRLVVKIERVPSKAQKPRYCITIFQGNRIATMCGENLEELVNAANALKNVDVLTLDLPEREQFTRIEKRFEREKSPIPPF